MKRPIQIAASVYSVAAFAYIVYSNETQTGICGYLVALQLKWSDTASGNITMIAAILIFALPLLAALPALMELGIPQVQDKFIYLPVTYPAFPRSWKTVSIITAVPLVATAAVYVVMRSGAGQNQTLYKLDLDQCPASLPGAAKFVELHGLLQREFVDGLKERNATDAYAPITGSAWTKDRPVKYFVHHTFYGDAVPFFPVEGDRLGLPVKPAAPCPCSSRTSTRHRA
jgi:hypothetical protein